MYLLDTNVCVSIINGNKSVMKSFSRKRNDCALPIVVAAELYKGAYCSTRIDSNLLVLNNFLRMLPVIELDLEEAETFGQIQSELKMIGRPTGDLDALIAAIARSNFATLVTHNTKDFENIPGLLLEDWLV